MANTKRNVLDDLAAGVRGLLEDLDRLLVPQRKPTRALVPVPVRKDPPRPDRRDPYR